VVDIILRDAFLLGYFYNSDRGVIFYGQSKQNNSKKYSLNFFNFIQRFRVIESNYNKYFKYLQQRKWTGLFYRKYWLYPRLSILLKGKTLDMGCGIGDLVRYRSNTVGVDINPHTVESCKSNGLDVKLMEIDSLPFGEKLFESVILDNVLEHIEKPFKIIKEVHRVLVDEGILIIGVPGFLGYASDSDHKVFYSKEKMIDTITGMGFYTKKTFSMPINLDWLSKRLRQYCIYGVFVKIPD